MVQIHNLLDDFSRVGIEMSNIKSYISFLLSEQESVGPLLASHVEGLKKKLDALWVIAQSSRDRAAKAAYALDEVYGLKAAAKGVSGSMLEAAERLIEQSLLTNEASRSEELLNDAVILTEAVKNILQGRKLDIRVSKSDFSDTGESEVSIASVETSRGTVKIYQTEEIQRYSNQTIVVTKNSFISLGKTIIIQKEVNRNIEQTAKDPEILVGKNIEIGAVLNIRKALNKPILEKIEYDVAVSDYSLERNLIRLVLSSENARKTGRLIIIDVDRSTMREFLAREVMVRVDGTPAKLASSLVEVLNGEVERPLYFLAITGRGVQIVLYIPTWSTKVVLIGPSSSLTYLISIPSVLGGDAQFLATTAAAVIFLTTLLITRLKRAR
ncbi:MAG: hypothetical protein RMI49_00325 [Candidatus Caldarchaeum sp.]|nr:hypothetical protein [Candidatus Caldarchaeum sp.]